jgi:hypothetical protein
MEPKASTRLKEAASRIGYSENQAIVESVTGILDLADDITNTVPRIVVLIRAARTHEKTPLPIGQESSSQNQIRRWWGA